MTRARPDIPVPPALIGEIVVGAESPRHAREMLDRLEMRLEGIADWRPYRPVGVVTSPDIEDDGEGGSR